MDFGVAVFSAVMNTVVEKVYEAAGDRLQSEQESNLEEELKDLVKKLSDLKEYLQDAEQKQSKDTPIRHWLREVEDFLYDAEDLLDDYAADVNFKMTEEIPTTEVSHLFGCFPVRTKNLEEEYKERLNCITKRYHVIMEERKFLQIQNLTELVPFPIASSYQRPQTISFTEDEVYIHGRSEMKSNIVNKLLGRDGVNEFICNDRYRFTVLPIIGMGGIGKTTLAKLVYHDKLIDRHFHVRIWVSVSNEFNVDNLRTEIMQRALCGDNNEKLDSSLDSLHIKFQKHMKDKRYLLVLDDVWNENQRLWDLLLEAMNVGIGSRIMVTTRNLSVVDAIVNHTHPIMLQPLSDDDTWKVFQDCAFRNFNSANSAQYSPFEMIGRQMLKKFKGSPLAAKLIGSLLSNHMELKYWIGILKNDLWADVNTDIVSILRISYQYLRPSLKRCFAYCSLYPEDFLFDEQDLVDLWIAEGFVKDESDIEPEDLGKKYFHELKGRSFFQPSFSDYVMHDLIHELAQSVSSETYTWVSKTRPKKLKQSTTIRHMSFHGNNIQTTTLMDACKFEKLRTLLIPYSHIGINSIAKSITEDTLEGWFTRLKYLRVLKLQYCGIKKLPDSIENLKLLRYLDLSYNHLMEEVPTSIGLCNKLEVMNLERCGSLDKLPHSLLGLAHMKRFRADRRCISSLAGIGKLVLLQELKYFSVSKEDGHTIKELNPLNQLHGSLEISGLENVNTESEATDAYLDKKEYLEKLILQWSNDKDTSENDKEKCVLECLRPHNYLKILTINNNHGSRPPTWMNRKDMPCLEIIEFKDCSKWEALPPLGAFFSLREISLTSLNRLKRIDRQLYGSGVVAPFPCLEKLFLYENTCLEEWEEFGSEEQCCFPKLRCLYIIVCPKLTKIPSLPSSIEEVSISGCGLASLKMTKSSINGSSKEILTSSNISSPPMMNKVTSNAKRLSFHCCHNLISIGEGVLGKTLEEVEILDCPELMIDYSPELFSSLKKLKILRSPKVDTSSILGRCVSSSLKELEIGDLDGVDELLSASCLGRFNELEKLSFCRCTSLSSYIETQDGIRLQNYASLMELRLRSCSTLFPHLFPCARTTAGADIGDKQLKISTLCIEDADIDNVLLHTLLLHQLLPSVLVGLVIRDCNNIKSLPDDVLDGLSSLSHLTIEGCAQLEYVGGFRSLDELHIGGCPNLTLVGQAASTSINIRSLHARNCSVQLLTQLLMQYHVISMLWVADMKGLACFDGELEEALLRQKLFDLYFVSCPDLLCLPTELQRLSSLQFLSIQHCPKIERLPKNLRGITTLRSLAILNCPALRKRYSVDDGGPDWKDVSRFDPFRYGT